MCGWEGSLVKLASSLCAVTTEEFAGMRTIPFPISFSDYGMGMNLGIVMAVDNVETHDQTPLPSTHIIRCMQPIITLARVGGGYST